MKKVLCVSGKDTCRGPILAALLRKELGGKFIVESAGTSSKSNLRTPSMFLIEMLERRH